MRPNPFAAAITLTGLLLHGPLLPRSATEPSRTSCSVCGGKIPPGKPGRRCEACRNSPTADIKS